GDGSGRGRVEKYHTGHGSRRPHTRPDELVQSVACTKQRAFGRRLSIPPASPPPSTAALDGPLVLPPAARPSAMQLLFRLSVCKNSGMNLRMMLVEHKPVVLSAAIGVF